MTPRQTRLFGTIKTLIADKGFGFITLDEGGSEYFFHQSGCTGVRFDELQRGARVSFLAGIGPKGPRAEQVERA